MVLLYIFSISVSFFRDGNRAGVIVAASDSAASFQLPHFIIVSVSVAQHCTEIFFSFICWEPFMHHIYPFYAHFPEAVQQLLDPPFQLLFPNEFATSRHYSELALNCKYWSSSSE